MKKINNKNQQIKFSLLNSSDSIQVTMDEVKFDLYLKSREVKQIIDSLQTVALMDRAGRQVWLNENEELLNQLLDTFMDDSLLVMDGIKMDDEAMEMSVELVTQLREALNIINSLLFSRRRLKS